MQLEDGATIKHQSIKVIFLTNIKKEFSAV